ncbi:MAG: Small-conductance mechanosensitive channel [Verrucomicrobiota bacterium]
MAAPIATTNDLSLKTPTEHISHWKEKGADLLLERGPNLVGAIIVLVAGFLLARFVVRMLTRWLEKRQMDPPVRMLLQRITWLLIMALFIMIALGTLGIAVGPLIALMSVAGVGVGLAMQGVLSNLVAGLLIIFTKPFRVGEYIEIIGCQGQVSVVDLFNTVLVHPDKSRVVIPNRKIVGEVLHNYGSIRQQDIQVGVSYRTDLAQAIAVIRQVLAGSPRVLKDPEPVVAVASFADSSINLAVRPWVNVSEFGQARTEIHLAIAEAFRQHRIEIPFPQRDVHLIPAPPAS